MCDCNCVTCPSCGTEFDPGQDDDQNRLESYIREKLDHSCYRDASYKWWQSDEMYVYLPRDNVYTTSISEYRLPEPWSINTVWCKDEKTIVSITTEERIEETKERAEEND